MLRTRNSVWVFSVGLCILIVFQVAESRNDVKEDILELLNEIKNEEHKSLQQLREGLLWQNPSNRILGTEPKLRKRQNSQHILWNKLGKLRSGSDSTSSLRISGKRTWDTQPEHFENTLFQYPNYEPSNIVSPIKTTKRVDSQQRLWTLLGDTTQSGSAIKAAGKRAVMFKRPNAHHIIWSKLGSVQNNDRLEELASIGKRTPTGQHMFLNTIDDLYRDPNIWSSLKTIVNQDSTLPEQPSKLDESDYIEEILREQETNDF